MAPVGKAWGKGRAKGELMRLLRDRIPAGTKNVRFGVVHVGIPEVVPPITKQLREWFGEHTEVLSAPATPVIATHLGIGAWGVAYLVEDD